MANASEHGDKQKFAQTTDGAKWAEAFISRFGHCKERIDEELMATWLANAIECGRDAEARKHSLELFVFRFPFYRDLVLDYPNDRFILAHIEGTHMKTKIQDSLKLLIDSANHMFEHLPVEPTLAQQEYQRGVADGLRNAIKIIEIA